MNLAVSIRVQIAATDDRTVVGAKKILSLRPMATGRTPRSVIRRHRAREAVANRFGDLALVRELGALVP